MNFKEKRELEEWQEAVKKDFLNHGMMSKETRNSLEKLDNNFQSMEKELRRLSDHVLIMNESIRFLKEVVEKIDDKYATKEQLNNEIKILKIGMNPTKKVVAYILAGAGGILITIITSLIIH